MTDRRLFCPLCYGRVEAYDQWGRLFIAKHVLRATVDEMDGGKCIGQKAVEAFCPMTNHPLTELSDTDAEVKADESLGQTP